MSKAQNDCNGHSNYPKVHGDTVEQPFEIFTNIPFKQCLGMHPLNNNNSFYFESENIAHQYSPFHQLLGLN